MSELRTGPRHRQWQPLLSPLRTTGGVIVLRVACADVDEVVVVRTGDLTVMYIPVIGDTVAVLAQARALLNPDELAIIRDLLGVPFESSLATYLRWWPAVCPCAIPTVLRSELDTTVCPLHADLFSAITEWGMTG